MSVLERWLVFGGFLYLASFISLRKLRAEICKLEVLQ